MNSRFDALLESDDELERPAKPITPVAYLSVANWIDDCSIDLIEPSDTYVDWLRVVILRAVVHTRAFNSIKSSFNLWMTKVFSFLGFENYEAYAKTREPSVLRKDLLQILSIWESNLNHSYYFPAELEKNLQGLAAIADLNETEKMVLGLAVLMHTETIFQECCDMMGDGISAFAAPKIFASLLNLKNSVVEDIFDDQSNLVGSGLISLDHRGEGNLRSRVDLLTMTFAKRAVLKQENVRHLIKGFVQSGTKPKLALDDFVHVQDRVDMVTDYLDKSLSAKQQGVNILIYGRPGTGKTEFAKLVAEKVSADPLEVVAMNLAGNPITPMRRIRSYRLAQSLFRSSSAVILFDECEEILNGEGVQFTDEDALLAQKSWINLTLETNQLPAIWIANSIEGFDPAYVRRFDMCFEMPLPSELQRRDMLTQECGELIDHALIHEIARHSQTSPALVAKTAQVVKTLGVEKTLAERNDLAMVLVNDKLQAQGVTQIGFSEKTSSLGFRPEIVNSPVDLTALRDGLSQTGEGRICLYGPPGTGKTAFGTWLAESMGMPHILLKASDLLGSRVGETEQKISRAFAAAKKQKAVLQFDEVDSFLMSRAQAKQSWEISMINTMLVELSAFRGIFIASTNLFDSLDEASLRRFDISIKFDYLNSTKVWEMFCLTCDKMGLDYLEQEHKPLVGRLKNLTPGDFEQSIRQGRFIKPVNAGALITSLGKAIDYKKTYRSEGIGFLH